MHQTFESRSPAIMQAAEGEIEQFEPGIRRQFLGFGPDLMLCRNWLGEDARGQVGWHPYSQSSCVQSGRFESIIANAECRLRTGDDFYVAPHCDNRKACRKKGVLHAVFSPARADFLKGEV